MKKLFILYLLLITPFMAKAYDFEDGKFGYTIQSLSDRTVWVTDLIQGTSDDYKIPNTAVYNGVQFSVTGIYFSAVSCSGAYAKSISIPSGVTQIVKGGMYVCTNLENLVIEDAEESLDCTCLDGINDILDGQFSRCKLNYVYVGRDLKYTTERYGYDYTRDLYPFRGQNNIEHFEFGASVTDISYLLDLDCNKVLKKVTLHNPTPPACPTFTNMQKLNIAVRVPVGALDAYKSAVGWCDFLDLKEIEDEACSINVNYDSTMGSVYINQQLVTDAISIKKGDNIAVALVPGRNCIVRSVHVNDNDLTNELDNNVLYIDNVQENKNIDVKFAYPDCSLHFTSNGGGAVAIPVEYGSSQSFVLEPETGWVVKSLFVNDVDFTNQMKDGKVSLQNITEDQYITTIFEKEGSSGIKSTNLNDLKISVEAKTFSIESSTNIDVQIYDTAGNLLAKRNTPCSFTVPSTGVYVVKVGQRIFKITI